MLIEEQGISPNILYDAVYKTKIIIQGLSIVGEDEVKSSETKCATTAALSILWYWLSHSPLIIPKLKWVEQLKRHVTEAYPILPDYL